MISSNVLYAQIFVKGVFVTFWRQSAKDKRLN